MTATDGIRSVALLLSIIVISGEGGTTESFRHDDWTRVLQQFVDKRGMVDYDALAHDRAVFDRYIERIKRFGPVSHPALFPARNDALAFYINAYNALVFDGVLDRGPEPSSVWRGLISGYGFFVWRTVQVGGESTNLKALEDDVVRAQFGDPRIHAALNCASISCPRLRRQAFSGDALDTELDSAMREFVLEQRNVSVSAAQRTVTLSKVFDWFEQDFLDYETSRGNSGGSLIDYVNRYRRADSRIPVDYRVRFHVFDKGINARL